MGLEVVEVAGAPETLVDICKLIRRQPSAARDRATWEANGRSYRARRDILASCVSLYITRLIHLRGIESMRSKRGTKRV